MCSTHRGVVTASTVAPDKSTKSKNRRKKVEDAAKKALANEELRLQVRKTLWQAAVSGKLETVFPKVLEAKKQAAKGELRLEKPIVDAVESRDADTLTDNSAASSCSIASEAAILDETSTYAGDTASNVSEGSHQADVDVERLRQQARQTFCDAMFSGKLDTVLGRAKGRHAVPSAGDSTSKVADIREEVRATLEKAISSGRLNEVLNKQQKAKIQEASQNLRERQPEKVEDTRDIDQLLQDIEHEKEVKAEKVQTPGTKNTKQKKKSRKSVAVQQDVSHDVDKAATDLSEKPEDSKAPETKTARSASTTVSTETRSTLAKGTKTLKDEQLLEGWRLVAPKMARHQPPAARHEPDRAPAAEPLSSSSLSLAETPASSSVSQPIVVQPQKLEARQQAAKGFTESSKRRGLPPPPGTMPPPPPVCGTPPAEWGEWNHHCAAASSRSSSSHSKVEPGLPDCAERLSPSAFQSIQIFPGTPESTPPSSPRKPWEEKDEVLVPIPIHLLEEVQQLLMARMQQSTAADSERSAAIHS